MGENLEFLALELDAVGSLNSLISILLLGVLNVSETTGQTISEALKLALLDLSELGEVLVDSLLGDSRSQVSHQDVGLGVRLVIHLLNTDSDHLVFDLRVVQFLLSFLCIILSLELRIAVVERLVSFLVNDDDGLNNSETLLLDHFVQIKVVELSGQVSDVQRG